MPQSHHQPQKRAGKNVLMRALEKIPLEIFCLFWLIFATVYSAHAAEKTQEKWVVYYGDALPAEQFLPYDLIVFDSTSFPPLRPLQNRDKMILGYLSLGEAEDYREDFQSIKEKGLLLHENKNWPGHFMVDVRNPLWGKYLIEEKIPQILFKRFNGIMFDTTDSVLDLEIKDPKKYAGMKKAVLDLLAAVRMHYPEIKIMINRGFDAFPEAAPYVDYIMAESTLVDDYTDPKNPRFFSESDYQWSKEIIDAARKANPQLKVYSVDYWNPKDMAKIKEIYGKQRASGYIPYVATIDLQSVVEEPR
jgi:uncharacterized protein (TIGR01370 family)